MQNYPPQPPVAPPPGVGGPGGSVYATGGQRYGGFWIRFVSVLIDSVVLAIPFGIVFYVLVAPALIAASTSASSGVTPDLTMTYVVYAVLGLLGLAYNVILWANGGTLGQRLLKLRVANATTGAPIGIGTSLLRVVVASFLNSIVCGIPLGYIWAGFDSRKQGWHDKISGTVVLQG